MDLAQLALERGRLAAVIAGLLFHGRDAPEVSALRWADAAAGGRRVWN